MGLLGKKLTDEEKAAELFSPYLDDRVTAKERMFLEGYFADHPESRQKFELLKTTVEMTKSLPAVKAPRSFVLPRSMERKPSFTLRLYSVMRVATVAATALFAFALLGDLTNTSRFSLPASTDIPGGVLVAASTATPLPLAEAPAPAADLDQPLILEESSDGEQAPQTIDAEVSTATAASFLELSRAADDATPLVSTPAPAPTRVPPEPEVETSVAADGAEDVASESGTGAQEPAPAEAAPSDADQSDEGQPDAALYLKAQLPEETSSLPTVDALRVAVIALGVLTVLLGATTFILRRQL